MNELEWPFSELKLRVEGAAGVGEEIENEGDSQILGISPELRRGTAWLSTGEPRALGRAPRHGELPPLLAQTQRRGEQRGYIYRLSPSLSGSEAPLGLSSFSKSHCTLYTPLPSVSQRPSLISEAPVPTSRSAHHHLPSSRHLTFTWTGRSLAWRMPVGSSPAAEPLSAPSPLAMTRGPRRLEPGRRDAPVFCRPALS